MSGSSDVGGLVGSSAGTVDGAYWDVPATGQATSDGGQGLGAADEEPPAAEYVDAFDYNDDGVVDIYDVHTLFGEYVEETSDASAGEDASDASAENDATGVPDKPGSGN